MKLGVLVLALLSVTVGQASQVDAKQELAKLQGDWLVSSFNGEQVPVEAEAYLVFKGDKYEQWTQNQVDERGTIKLDVTSKPMKIDLVITEGADAGKTQLGVYVLEGDTLTVTLAAPGEAGRPAALGQGELHVVLTKAK